MIAAERRHDSPVVATGGGKSRVWTIAAEASGHYLRQLPHDFAFVGGYFLVDRGVGSLQELIVLVLQYERQFRQRCFVMWAQSTATCYVGTVTIRK